MSMEIKSECRELSDGEIDSVAGGLIDEIVQAVKHFAHVIAFELDHLAVVIRYGEDPRDSQH